MEMSGVCKRHFQSFDGFNSKDFSKVVIVRSIGRRQISNFKQIRMSINTVPPSTAATSSRHDIDDDRKCQKQKKPT
ncbi:hypothetical protein L596_022703 [Steinernema carpocapsae]|uniref:Uncharacterized protein n=1 Tax=Steinernema carpocapsae TaxID=34508 RepID=A0A4V6A0A7_STECR|nr:hypothetical protein L596_022703 [Steinernema carpocapsae]